MYKILEEKETKTLTQIEFDNIIDNSINLSILLDLKDLKLIDEKQFYILKEKYKVFIKIICNLKKN